MVSTKEVVEIKEKKTRKWTAEETNLFCSILADLVAKFMLALEWKALKKVATKEVFEAILEELKTTFMEEPFKTLNEKSLKGKESLNLDIKKLHRKYNNLKQQWKNGYGFTGAQDPTWYHILNPVLSNTNEGMDWICSNPADILLSNFFRQEKENKEVGIFFLSTFYQP